MANQTKLLGVLAARPGHSLTLDEVCAAFAPGKSWKVGTSLRKEVLSALAKLLRKELVTRTTEKRRAFASPVVLRFQITKSGQQLHASGKAIDGVVRGPSASVRKPQKNRIRQRLWEALRRMKKATAAELVELAATPADGDPVKVIKHSRHYLNQLVRAGIVVHLKRAPGFAPKSSGFARFGLVNDLGPIAPSAGDQWITDHNAGNAEPPREARIPYREGK
jgi:predicted transcriptional regulator